MHKCLTYDRYTWFPALVEKEPVLAYTLWIALFIAGMVIIVPMLYYWCKWFMFIQDRYTKRLMLEEFQENSRFYKE